MPSYELCVWYSEHVTIEAPNAKKAEQIACQDGSFRYGSLGGVHATEVIKVDGEWTPSDTWRYSGQIGKFLERSS